MSPRFATIPAGAVRDSRLTNLDLRIYILLGTHTDVNGWCFRNQKKIASDLNVTLRAVNRSIARICACGYLEKRDINADAVASGKRKKGMKSICIYHVKTDNGKEATQAMIDGAFAEEESETADLSIGLQSRNRYDSGVSTVTTPESQLNNSPYNNSLRTMKKPNKPKKAYSPSSSPSPKAALSVEAKEIKAVQKTAKAERRGKSQPDLIDMPDTSNAAKDAERAFEDAVVQRFNAIAVPHKIAPVVRLTAQRRQTLRVLIKSGFDVNSALDALGRASFPTKNGWTPENFDAVFREQTITQLLEGKFAAHIVSFEDEQVKRWRQRIKAWIDRGRVHWPETWGRMCDIPAEIQREFPNEVFGGVESDNLTKNGGVK